MIIQYVRKNDGQAVMFGRKLTDGVCLHRGTPIGVVVAIKIGTNCFSIGWAKCNKKDMFQKKLGVKIASGRAALGEWKVYADKASKIDESLGKIGLSHALLVKVPREVVPVMQKVLMRGMQYFFKNV